MASVIEPLDSRVGSKVGIDGVILPRLFRVIVDNAADDPVRVLQNHVDGVPYLAAHPLNPLAVATNYLLAEQQTPKATIIEVVYEVLTTLERGIGVVPGWSARYRGYAETEPVLQEVLDARARRTPRRIGTPKYRIANAGETSTHSYKDPVRVISIPLVQTGATVQFDLHRRRAAATLVLTKDKPNYIPSSFGEAVTYLGKANYSTFFGADPGHIEFAEIDIDPRGAEMPAFSSSRVGGASLGIPHGITLSFVWSENSRALLDLVHVFDDEDGDPHVVIGPGTLDQNANTPAIDQLQVAQTREMRALLALFT